MTFVKGRYYYLIVIVGWVQGQRTDYLSTFIKNVFGLPGNASVRTIFNDEQRSSLTAVDFLLQGMNRDLMESIPRLTIWLMAEDVGWCISPPP